MERRIHFLDQLRSHMMLLGIFLHVAGNYNTMPPGYIWPFKDTEVHGFFSATVFFIHCFRMQVFFFVAGFFMFLLLEKRGTNNFIKNRTQRILIPFLTLAPLIGFGCYHLFLQAANQMAGRGIQIDFPDAIPLYHLWFLYYLMIYYCLFLLINRVAKSALSHYSLPFLLLALGAIPMIRGSYQQETAYSFAIAWGTFFHYGSFFLLGVIAFREREWFFRSVAKLRTPLAASAVVVLGLLASFFVTQESGDDPESATWHGSLMLGLFYFCLCWLIITVYRRLMDRPSKTARYLADASYWMYLVHLPFAIGIPMAVAALPLPVFAKFILSFSMVLGVCLISYHFLVRPTWLGKLLSGRKYASNRTGPALKNA